MDPIAVGIFAFILGVVITRWMFRIDTIVSNQQVTMEEVNKIRLLTQKMAEKQGVSKEDIDFVIRVEPKKKGWF